MTDARDNEPKWDRAARKFAAIRLSHISNITPKELMVELAFDDFGAPRLQLRVRKYVSSKNFTTESVMTLPAHRLGAIIEALERMRRAVAAEQSQSPMPASHDSTPVKMRQARVRRDVRRDDEQLEHARRLQAAGKKPEEIAAAIGCSRATVYRWLNAGTLAAADATNAPPATQPDLLN